MSQINYGIRKLLENPVVYSLFQNLIGTTRLREKWVKDFIKLKSGESVLDVGCGPGDIVKFIPLDVQYLGFDFEKSYILKAKARWKRKNVEFELANVNTFNFKNKKFDKIIMFGLLHHLTDIEVVALFENLQKILAEDGSVYCVENVYEKSQSFFARYLISKDRGQNVRTPEGYVSLCNRVFKEVSYTLSHDELRIPYTHIFINCFQLKQEAKL